jgi:lysozyme family protein
VAEQVNKSKKISELLSQYSEYFNENRRKVILAKEIVDEKSAITLNIEEIKQDFEKLIENENIPDWYLEEEGISKENTFDFGNTIERTQFF